MSCPSSMRYTTGQFEKRGSLVLVSSTDSGVKRSSSISKPVILRAPSLRLLHGVLLAGALELGADDLLGIQVESVREEQRVGEDVGQLVGHLVPGGVGVPLEALEQ